jgi:DNA repair protein RecN (Recombination protein N)
LGLALAGRASPDLIRTGQDRASVTAVFRAHGVAPWETWLEEHGMAGRDNSEIILRREMQSNGKTRLLVNDQPATVSAVKALAPRLVEVHGQSEHTALFAREAQLAVLDQFAGAEATLEKVGSLFKQRDALEREMETLRSGEQERLRTIDLLSFQAKELDAAKLQPGEDSRLEEEKRVLLNLEKLRAAASSAYGQLYEEEGSACAKLAVVSRALEELRRYDAALEPYLKPLAATRAELDDLSFFLRAYLEKLESSPGRLDEVEERLALIDRLKRKYGSSIEAIVVYRDSVQKQLGSLEHADERREEVQRQLEKATGEYRAAARELSDQRREEARKLERFVEQELAQVGMEKTRFEVCLEALPEDRGGPTGVEAVEFLISPNPGEELRALEKIASGGELSRLMLALKTVAGKGRARDDAGLAPTFIFDEVDVGIGGRVAEAVGQRLKRLAREAQVLCVTHLAQIACFADRHFVVEKFERAGRTVTEVKVLQNERERAQELSRMLSGRQITDAVLKHAATMLKQAAG